MESDGENVVPGLVWCIQCATGDDCPDGQACSYGGCGAGCSPGVPASCPSGEVCEADYACHVTCDAGACPGGQACDSSDAIGNGVDICYPCLGPGDCSEGQGESADPLLWLVLGADNQWRPV